MKVNIFDITEAHKHNLHVLRLLYRNNVDNNISEFALSLMREMELKRHIALSIYINSIKFRNRQRRTIKLKLCLFLDTNENTINSWIREYYKAKSK